MAFACRDKLLAGIIATMPSKVKLEEGKQPKNRRLNSIIGFLGVFNVCASYSHVQADSTDNDR